MKRTRVRRERISKKIGLCLGVMLLIIWPANTILADSVDGLHQLMPEQKLEDYNRFVKNLAAQMTAKKTQPETEKIETEKIETEELQLENQTDLAEETISAQTQGMLPARYDPRDNQLATSVKDQGSLGLCWDYAAIATCESALLRQGYETGDIDLSEFHAAYFAYRQEWYSRQNQFLTYCQNGGGAGSVFACMKNAIGPVWEKDYPMPTQITEQTQIPEGKRYEHLYEIRRLPIKKMDSDAASIQGIKEMIASYGGAALCFYLDQNFWKALSGTTSYYYPYDIATINHQVEIVGWDDNYSKTNFKNLPPDNGAWLLKNSYGTAPGNDGYIWLSYFDGSINGEYIMAVSFAKNNTTPAKIELSESELILPKESMTQITAQIFPLEAENKTILWESSDTSIATVDAKGVVYAKANGTCQIRASAVEGRADTQICEVSVVTKAREIEHIEDMVLLVGESKTILPRVLPVDTSDKSICIRSEDENVLEVQNQRLIAKAPGTVKVRIQCLDGSGLEQEFLVQVMENAILSIIPYELSGPVVLDYAAVQNYYTFYLAIESNFDWKGTDFDVEVSETELADAYIGVSKIGDKKYLEITLFLKGSGDFSVIATAKDAMKKSAGVSFQILPPVVAGDADNEDQNNKQESSEDNKEKQENNLGQKVPQKEEKNPVISEITDGTTTPATSNPPVLETKTICQRYGHQIVVKLSPATMTKNGVQESICNVCQKQISRQQIAFIKNLIGIPKAVVYNGARQKPLVTLLDGYGKDITKHFRITFAENKKVGTGTIRIQNKDGYYKLDKELGFRILPLATTIRKVDNTKKGTLLVKWKSITKECNGYELQYSKTKNFTDGQTKTIRITKQDQKQYRISGLTRKKYYYLRIRTYKKVNGKRYVSKWSKVEKWKTI